MLVHMYLLQNIMGTFPAKMYKRSERRKKKKILCVCINRININGKIFSLYPSIFHVQYTLNVPCCMVYAEKNKI